MVLYRRYLENSDTKCNQRVRIPRIQQKTLLSDENIINHTHSDWRLKTIKKQKEEKEMVLKSASILYKHNRSLNSRLGGSAYDLYRKSFYGLFQTDKTLAPKKTYMSINSPKSMSQYRMIHSKNCSTTKNTTKL